MELSTLAKKNIYRLAEHVAGRPLRQDDDTRRCAEELVVSVAQHEAAHAVLWRYLLGEPPELVTIERGSERVGELGLGFVRHTRGFLKATDEILQQLPRDYRAHLRKTHEHCAMMNLAGHVFTNSLEPSQEQVDVEDLLYVLECDEDHDLQDALQQVAFIERNKGRRWRRLCRLAEQADAVLKIPEIRKYIDALAHALLQKPTLDQEEVMQILETLQCAGLSRPHKLPPLR